MLAAAVVRLTEAGVESPRLDAELLLAEATGRSRTSLIAHLPDEVSPQCRERLDPLLRRRVAREPLPYVLGRWEFWGRSFEVNPSVLIPRPETETLVSAVLDRLDRTVPQRVLEIGTGSGCIAAALASSGVQVVTVEKSPEAASTARRNLAPEIAAGQVRVVEAGFPDLPDTVTGPFAALVSNPPYIASEELHGLQPEVGRWEPRLALDGGADGLALIRLLITEAPRYLAPRGLVALECALGQSRQVRALLLAAGYECVETHTDLSGIERVVVATGPQQTRNR